MVGSLRSSLFSVLERLNLIYSFFCWIRILDRIRTVNGEKKQIMKIPIFLSSVLACEILNLSSVLGGLILDFLFPFLLFCYYSFLPPWLIIRIFPCKK